MPCALAALAVSALFVRLWRTVQHLEIDPRRLMTSRKAGRRRYRLAAPTRELEATWCLPVEADRWLRREPGRALAERLRDLGREVTRPSV